MTDIIKELFSSALYMDLAPSKELQALRKEEEAIWEKIQPLLGMDVIDELHNIQVNIANEQNLIWFREGFRLGAGLMLEL